MKVLDLTLPTPAENLALDEALLDAAEAGQSGEILRFWDSPETFVVVGYANRVTAEVNVRACEARGIPVLRRCSGGGTVVQGPGCLNYALVLPINEQSSTHTISAANVFIMQRNRQAIQSVLDDSQPPISVRGHTDLAVGNLKFSGNSQRRRKSFLLFHGTFLLNFNLELVSELLNMPSLQPDYRQGRSHGDFVVNLGVSAIAVKTAMCRMWNATEEPAGIPAGLIAQLVATKYANRDWIQKF